MTIDTSHLAPPRPGILARADRADLIFYPALIAVGIVVWWLCRDYAARLPWWMPWEFSWLAFFAMWLTLWWFYRGVALSPPEERPSVLRRVVFTIGMVAIYGVLQTRFEYLAQHMFFFNRMQHSVMHHSGPFLIALVWPGAMILRGMPAPLRRLTEHRVVRAVFAVVQQPLLAAFLFVGLLALWLYPPVHFHAMLNLTLYDIMNWSMIIDGVLFWSLILDPRPKPPAHTSFGMRAAMVCIVIFPQIAIGASIVFAGGDIYPSYDLCGRFYTTISATYDQMVGGLIVWIPGSMMSLIGLLFLLNNLRLSDIRMESHNDDDESAVALDARGWTG
jgi:putative membrane protein